MWGLWIFLQSTVRPKQTHPHCPPWWETIYLFILLSNVWRKGKFVSFLMLFSVLYIFSFLWRHFRFVRMDIELSNTVVSTNKTVFDGLVTHHLTGTNIFVRCTKSLGRLSVLNATLSLLFRMDYHVIFQWFIVKHGRSSVQTRGVIRRSNRKLMQRNIIPAFTRSSNHVSVFVVQLSEKITTWNNTNELYTTWTQNRNASKILAGKVICVLELLYSATREVSREHDLLIYIFGEDILQSCMRKLWGPGWWWAFWDSAACSL